jgi:hypothetical protein
VMHMSGITDVRDSTPIASQPSSRCRTRGVSGQSRRANGAQRRLDGVKIGADRSWDALSAAGQRRHGISIEAVSGKA